MPHITAAPGRPRHATANFTHTTNDKRRALPSFTKSVMPRDGAGGRVKSGMRSKAPITGQRGRACVREGECERGREIRRDKFMRSPRAPLIWQYSELGTYVRSAKHFVASPPPPPPPRPPSPPGCGGAN